MRSSYNDAIAVEMEGFGFLSAAFAHPSIKAVVIRGISDLIEGKNDASSESGQEAELLRQEQASQHASAFAFEVLAKSPVATNTSGDDTEKQSILAEIEQLQAQIDQIDRQFEKDIYPELKDALDWLSNNPSQFSRRVVFKALEDCPDLETIVKREQELEEWVCWELEKYLESIHNAFPLSDIPDAQGVVNGFSKGLDGSV